MAAYSLPKRLLHWYSVAAAASVLLLICSGGLVTGHEAGMAVQDWANSFGYNMFLFPVSRWVGGVFFEHTHRLIGSGVGLVTIALCVAFFFKAEDGIRNPCVTGVQTCALPIYRLHAERLADDLGHRDGGARDHRPGAQRAVDRRQSVAAHPRRRHVPGDLCAAGAGQPLGREIGRASCRERV